MRILLDLSNQSVLLNFQQAAFDQYPHPLPCKSSFRTWIQQVIGIQVADLFATGFRRLWKGEFVDNDTAARMLDQMTLQAAKGSFPLNLVTMGKEQLASPALTHRLKLLRQHNKAMLVWIVRSVFMATNGRMYFTRDQSKTWTPLAILLNPANRTKAEPKEPQ